MKSSNFRVSVFLKLFILFLVWPSYVFSQTGCTNVTSTSNNKNFNFNSSTTYCIVDDVILNNASIGNNTTIKVQENKTLIISNDITGVSSGNKVKLEVKGILRLEKSQILNSNLDIHIYPTGNLIINNGTGDLTLNGADNKIINEGTIILRSLIFNGNTNFDNYNTLSVSGDITANSKLLFNNYVNLAVGTNFKLSASSKFSNCGYFTTTNFDLQGGIIYNTGSLAVLNNLDGAGTIVNHSNFTVNAMIGASKNIQNLGRITVKTNTLSDVVLTGTTANNNYGEFIWAGKSTANKFNVNNGNHKLKNSAGNSTQAEMFNTTTVTFDANANVAFGDCSTCFIDTIVLSCYDVTPNNGNSTNNDEIICLTDDQWNYKVDTDKDGIPDSVEFTIGGVPSPNDLSGKYIINILYDEDFGTASSNSSGSVKISSLPDSPTTNYEYYSALESPKVTDWRDGDGNPQSLQDGRYTIHHHTGNLSTWTLQNNGTLWRSLSDHTSTNGLGRMYIVNAGDPLIGGKEAYFFKKNH